MNSTNKITRVEVIDHDGRSYTNFNPYHKVKLSFQDDGRTLKVFISIRKKMTDKTQKLVNAFDERYENLGPFDGDWQELCIAQTLRELIKQCSYNHFYLDGDHGIDVINVKDIMEIIEELEP
jgi:hypothetical protein